MDGSDKETWRQQDRKRKIQNSLKRKKIKPKSPQIQKQRALEQKKVEKKKRPKRRTLLKKRTKERRRM